VHLNCAFISSLKDFRLTQRVIGDGVQVPSLYSNLNGACLTLPRLEPCLAAIHEAKAIQLSGVAS
jgi:hypothetical protein